MVLLNLCSNLYFPFLTYLANLKGLCNGLTTIPATPVITYPTTIIINTTQQTQPPVGPPPSSTVRPVTVLCPAIPLACLLGGVSPIAGCPCIDPRQTNGGFGVVNGVLTALPQQNLFPTTLGINNVQQLPTTILPGSQQFLTGGQRPGFGSGPNPNNNQQQAQASQRSGALQQNSLTNPDVMVFSSLGKKRRSV